MKKSEYFNKAGEEWGPAVTLAPDTCLSKAADDEVIFVLRAKDPIAADVVEIWATLASKDHEYEKVESARKCAHAMRMWLLQKLERELGNEG